LYYLPVTRHQHPNVLIILLITKKS
ncbi:uncharacterized protein METZ01_LOCUS465446, partial [marine metagenome]